MPLTTSGAVIDALLARRRDALQACHIQSRATRRRRGKDGRGAVHRAKRLGVHTPPAQLVRSLARPGARWLLAIDAQDSASHGGKRRRRRSSSSSSSSPSSRPPSLTEIKPAPTKPPTILLGKRPRDEGAIGSRVMAARHAEIRRRVDDTPRRSSLDTCSAPPSRFCPSSPPRRRPAVRWTAAALRACLGGVTRVLSWTRYKRDAPRATYCPIPHTRNYNNKRIMNDHDCNRVSNTHAEHKWEDCRASVCALQREVVQRRVWGGVWHVIRRVVHMRQQYLHQLLHSPTLPTPPSHSALRAPSPHMHVNSSTAAPRTTTTTTTVTSSSSSLSRTLVRAFPLFGAAVELCVLRAIPSSQGGQTSSYLRPYRRLLPWRRRCRRRRRCRHSTPQRWVCVDRRCALVLCETRRRLTVVQLPRWRADAAMQRRPPRAGARLWRALRHFLMPESPATDEAAMSTISSSSSCVPCLAAWHMSCVEHCEPRMCEVVKLFPSGTGSWREARRVLQRRVRLSSSLSSSSSMSGRVVTVARVVGEVDELYARPNTGREGVLTTRSWLAPLRGRFL